MYSNGAAVKTGKEEIHLLQAIERSKEPPDPEVVGSKTSRRYSLSFKRRILEEADTCEPGQLGALLRREGLYSSTLRDFRRQRDQGLLDSATSARKTAEVTDRKVKDDAPRAQLHELEKENRRLKKQLHQAQIIIEFQKKTVGGAGDSLGNRSNRGRSERREATERAERRKAMITTVEALSEEVGAVQACRAFDLSRATFYRRASKQAIDQPSKEGMVANISSEDPSFSEPSFERDSLLTGKTESSQEGKPLSPVKSESVSPVKSESVSPVKSEPVQSGSSESHPLPSPLAPHCRVPGRALSLEERQQALDLLHSDRFVDLSPAEVYATLLDEGIYLGSIRTLYRLLASQNEIRERRFQRSRTSFQRPELLATQPNEVWSWDITKL